MTIICLFILNIALVTAVSIGGVRAKVYTVKFYESPAKTIGEGGLILSQGNISMVLLESPSKKDGKRVVSIPGQPLLYQAVPMGPGSRILSLPPAPFNQRIPYYLESLKIDFSMSTKLYDTLMARDLINFLIYLGSITLLLCSLRFVFTLSMWPLANLFFGALVFRAVLSLEIFINSESALQFIGNFIGNRLETIYFGPLILGILALLIIFYSILAKLTQRK